MANKEGQPTEEYKTPILSAIYKVFGFVTTGAGILALLMSFTSGRSEGLGQSLLLVLAGVSLYGIAQVITFIGEIAVNTRVTANNSAILAANANGQVNYAEENEEIVLNPMSKEELVTKVRDVL